MKRLTLRILGTIFGIIGVFLVLNSFTQGTITGNVIAYNFSSGVLGSILGMGFIIGGLLLILISQNKTKIER